MIINRGDEYRLTYICDGQLKTEELKCYVSFDTKEFPNSIFEIIKRAKPTIELKDIRDDYAEIYVNDKHLGNIWITNGEAHIASTYAHTSIAQRRSLKI